MGRAVIIDESVLKWQSAHKTGWPGATIGQPDVRYKLLSSEREGGPNIQLAEYEAQHVEPPHSHPHDEILYILDGGGTFGDRDLRAGLLLFIEKDTVYGPIISGDHGMKFLRVQMSDYSGPK